MSSFHSCQFRFVPTGIDWNVLDLLGQNGMTP